MAKITKNEAIVLHQKKVFQKYEYKKPVMFHDNIQKLIVNYNDYRNSFTFVDSNSDNSDTPTTTNLVGSAIVGSAIISDQGL